MAISGSFVLFLLVALVGFVLTMTLRSWVAKLILFIVTLGAVAIATSVAGLAAGWSMLINAVLAIVVGIPSVRIKDTGSKVFGIILIVVGIALVFPAIGMLGIDTPGTVWGAITDSFRQGWDTFADMLRRVFGAA